MKETLFGAFDRLYLGLGRAFGREQRVRAALAERAVQNPKLVEPPAGRLLVIAPHPDDESIGCGGAILRAAGAGAEVYCVLVSGGEAGRADWAADETARVRRAEMQASAELLGVREVVYLPGRDGRLGERPELAGELREVLTRFNPDAVFLPFFMDTHLDHRQTNEIFLSASSSLSVRLPVWAYEVWSPCPANAAIDISAVAECKAEAIRLHASQDGLMHYSTAILGLNAFRALQVNWRADPALTHAEAYVRLPLARYRELAAEWLGRSK